MKRYTSFTTTLFLCCCLAAGAQFPCVDGYIAAIEAQLSKGNYREANNKLLDMKENCRMAELQQLDGKRRAALADLVSRISTALPRMSTEKKAQNTLFPRWNETTRKYGYFDKAGKKLIDFIYDDAEQFEQGHAYVKMGDNEGLIGANGKEIAPLKYFDIEYSDDGDDILDARGSSVLPQSLQGKKVSVEGVESVGAVALYLNRTILKVGDQMGLYDCSLQQFIIPLDDHEIGGLGISVPVAAFDPATQQPLPMAQPVIGAKDFLLLITKKNSYGEDAACAIVNFNNEIIVPFGRYDKINQYGPFDGLIEVRKGEQYGFIDCRGVERTGLVYEEADTPWDGLIAVKDTDTGLWGFIDYAGKKVIEFRFSAVKKEKGYFKNGLCAVQNKAGRWGFANIKGELAIPYGYTDVTPFLGNYALVQNNFYEWKLIGRQGNDIKLDRAYVTGAYKTGFMDRRGNVVTADYGISSGVYFEAVDEKGETVRISKSIIPYYINFEGFRQSDYLELISIDINTNTAHKLLVTAGGKHQYRVSSLLRSDK